MENTDRKNKTVLITGADGFIGRSLCISLREKGYCVIPSVRRETGYRLEDCDVREIGPATDWSIPLNGADCIIHLASATDPGQLTKDRRKELWLTNVDGTRNLAEQAAAAGIQRFIYLSTAKVNGGRSQSRAFREDDKPEPPDYYSLSKLRAEQSFPDIAAKTGMETVIIRPPLIYGSGVKGNFLRLLNWIQRGVPLPFAALDNRRSLIGLDNLIDFIIRSLEHPGAGNDTFLISDGQDLSTPTLIRDIAVCMEKAPRLFPIPRPLMHYAGTLLGRKEEVDRLCGSFQVDSTKAGEKMAWSPPFPVKEELRKTVSWYLDNV